MWDGLPYCLWDFLLWCQIIFYTVFYWHSSQSNSLDTNYQTRLTFSHTFTGGSLCLKGSNIQYIHITIGHYLFLFFSKFSFIPGLNREIIKIKVEQWSHMKKYVLQSLIIRAYSPTVFSECPCKVPEIPVGPAIEVLLMQLPVMVWQQCCTAPEFRAELPLS